MKSKFTFKTERPTGSYSSFFPSQHDIKLKKKKVGMISDRQSKNPWQIRLMIEKDEKHDDGNPNCSWMWISLRKQSNTLQEAKDFLNENIDNILKLYNLHYLDN